MRGIGQHRRPCVVDLGLLTRGRLQQRRRAIEGEFGVLQLRLRLLHGRLLGCEIRLERRLFENVKKVTLLHLRTLNEIPLFQERGHARDQGHTVDCLNAPDELRCLGNGLLLGAHNTNSRRAARAGRLRVRGCEVEQQNRHGKNSSRKA